MRTFLLAAGLAAAGVFPLSAQTDHPSAATRTIIIVPETDPSQPATSIPSVPSPNAGYDGPAANSLQPVAVRILSPKPEEVLQKNGVDVFFDVQNYSLAPGGNRLHVIVNNNAPVAIDNARKPLVLKELPEGGHTVRVFAVRPDGLALTNPEAFAQVHFFIRKKNFLNYSSPELPYLTVNLPVNGTVDVGEGERVWLDFRTHNAPLAAINGFAVKYKINNAEGLVNENRQIFWDNLRPGKYQLTAELVSSDGASVPGAFNFVKRAFEVRIPAKAEAAASPESAAPQNVMPAQPVSPVPSTNVPTIVIPEEATP